MKSAASPNPKRPVRRAPAIQLIGLDFDNTLYDGDRSLALVLPWFEDLRARGIRLGLVTGRTFGSLRELFEKDGYVWGEPFPEFAICYESLILDPLGQTVAGCEEWNRLRNEDLSRAHEILEREFPEWKRLLEAQRLECRTVYLDPNYGLYLDFFSPEEAIAATELLRSKTRPEYPLHFSRNHRGLSIHARDRSKGPAVEAMLRAMGIPQNEALVIGDSLNDLCMMDPKYGFQVATVSNADPMVRAAVELKKGMIADEPCSRGVVQIFERLFGRKG
ncbi:MAG: HAD family phosphatase [Verrucomicrobiae bacterium]|nr:HAD family phosphatase [Verrucomicrobiae bacterium]